MPSSQTGRASLSSTVRNAVRAYFKFTVLLALSVAYAGDDRAALTVALVMSRAKANADYLQVSKSFPIDLTVTELDSITRRLMLDVSDRVLTDEGVTYREAAIDYSLAQLAALPGGGPIIVAIADDAKTPVDGARSISLCEAAIRRGREMLTLLEGMKLRKDWGARCAEHIRAGHKSAS